MNWNACGETAAACGFEEMTIRPLREEIRGIVEEAVRAEFGSGEIRFSVEPPPPGFSGDYATNAGLLLAKRLGLPPPAAASRLAARLSACGAGLLEKAEPSAGFVNMTVRRERMLRQAAWAAAGSWIPASPSPQKILVEFVSANPTGPLHLGHGRGAAIGDSLARLLKARGHRVETEYYINDVGTQMETLAASVEAAARDLRGEPALPPTDGYRGEYIREIAARALEKMPADLGRFAMEEILAGIRRTLERFRVRMDRWQYESEFHADGLVEEILRRLQETGGAFEKDSALWLQDGREGRVLRRRNGRPTYLAGDIAYHIHKARRAYDLVVNVLGSDHAEEQRLVLSAMERLGEKSRFAPIFYQFVTLLRGGERQKMSTRSGTYLTLDDLVSEIGCDAARFFLLLRRPSSHLELDVDLAKKRVSENPVYYIQYSHARIRSLYRKAAEIGLDPKEAARRPEALAGLREEEEIRLARRIGFFPDVLEICERDLSTHHLPEALLETARAFHAFYDRHRILEAPEPIRTSRLALAEATRRILADGLEILGVSAPERM